MKKYKLHKGLLVAIEGIDGAGKTTQVLRLKEHFQRQGFKVSTFKEPTDGEFGLKIRKIAKEGRHLYNPIDEMNLFLMDRKEDCQKNIKPALDACELVIMDRYYFSSVAYQGALGIDTNIILKENEKIAIIPDLVLILDCAVRVGLRRIQYQRNEEPNHFEQEEYLEKVRKIFMTMQASYIQHIDSTPDEDTVFNHIKNVVQDIIAPSAIKVEDQGDLFSIDSKKDKVTFSNN